MWQAGQRPLQHAKVCTCHAHAIAQAAVFAVTDHISEVRRLWTVATNRSVVHSPHYIWVWSYGGMIFTG